MKWEKLGRVYCADEPSGWQQSHAYVPTPYRFDEGTIRVYCAFLDDDNIGRVGYVDVDATDPTRVISVSEEPVLSVGEPGCFDSFGVTPSSITKLDSGIGLYYFGWNRHPQIPYTMFSGLAVSDDGGETFQRFSQVPILDRTNTERFARSAPTVTNLGDEYACFYVSADEWIAVDGKEIPTYNLRTKRSEDGMTWSRSAGEVVLRLANDGDEFGFGRPFVRCEENKYRLWYSIRTRSKGYRIGYAESDDGYDFKRLDHLAGIDVSERGWDSEMVCFPAIIDANDERYMFYNGNDYGRTGFGVARLESA